MAHHLGWVWVKQKGSLSSGCLPSVIHCYLVTCFQEGIWALCDQSTMTVISGQSWFQEGTEFRSCVRVKAAVPGSLSQWALQFLWHWSQFVPNMSTQHPRTLSPTSSSSSGWNHVFVWLVNHDGYSRAILGLVNHDGYSRAILGPGKVSLEPDPSPKFHCRFSDLRGNLRVEHASQTCSTVPSTQILTTQNTAIYLEQQIWYDSPCNRLIFLNSFFFTFSLFLPHSMESQLWWFYLKLTIFAEKVFYPPSPSCFSTYSDNPGITVLQ